MVADRIRLTSVLSFLSAFLMSAAPAAQSIKLNGPLLAPGTGDVLGDYAYSPSSARMVYRANVEAEGVFELYSSVLDASAPPVRLVPGAHVASFATASGRVVYLSDLGSGINRLFQVPQGGGASIDLSGSLVAGGDVTAFQLTPDRASAVFRADKVVDGRIELFSVPIDGSAAPTRLDPGFVTGAGSPMNVWVTSDSDTVLFSYLSSAAFNETLYSVPLDGSAAPILLGQAPGSFGDGEFAEVQFTPDDAHAVFTVWEMFDGDIMTSYLFSVPVDGSHEFWLLDSEDFTVHAFAVAAGGRVVFRIENDRVVSCALDGTQRIRLDPAGGQAAWTWALAPYGDTVVFTGWVGSVYKLYSAPVDGSEPATVLVGSGSFSYYIDFLDPQHIVYRDGFTLYSLELGGGSPVDLSDSLSASTPATLMPNGLDVVFPAAATSGVFELYTTPLDGSAPPRRISAPMSGSKDVSSYRVSTVEDRLAYLADQTEEGTNELFAVDLASSEAPRAYIDVQSGPTIGDVTGFRVTPDEESVVYYADQFEDERFSLFDAPVSGFGVPQELQYSSYSTLPFVFSPDGDYVVFEGSANWLISTRRTGAPEPHQLDSILGTQFEVSPDNARIVYLRGSLSVASELRSVPITGPGTNSWVRLSTHTGFSDRAVASFQIGSDSTRVAYLHDEDANNVFELFSAPIDGSAAALKLNTPLSASRDVGAYEITPDSSLVVYIADQDLNDLQELYSVPLDGSAAPTKLNGALIAAGDVTAFVLSPDGSRVVYLADQVVDGRHELFSVELQPGPPVAVQLTAFAGWVESDFQVDPSSTLVVFRGLENMPGVLELFSVPIDGSAAPTRLSAALVAGGGVLSFAVSPDGARVVYRADQTTDQTFELFSVLASGGAVTALDPLSAFADVDVYRIAPDSLNVVYRVDRNTDGVLELYGAPLDGATAARRLNNPLPAGSHVQSDFAALSDGRAVYRADQEETDVFEIFMARIRPAGNGSLQPGPSGPLRVAPTRGL